MKNTILQLILMLLVLGACERSEEPTLPESSDKTLYGTWINVWQSQSGWSSEWKMEDLHGLQTEYPDGTWKSMNWDNKEYRQHSYNKLLEAGIDFIITDNTNGQFQKTNILINDLKEWNYPFKYCVAVDNTRYNEENIKEWLSVIVKEDNYLRIEGKPVLVCYVSMDLWNNVYKNADNDSFLQSFYRVWASGENSDSDKWGWQLEPEDAVIYSKFSAFVSPSVKHEGQVGKESCNWSSSLAMLDYTFWQSKTYKSQYVIVGSYDDSAERNMWLPLKTENARPDLPKYTPVTGVQIFDPWTGRIAEPYLYYDRVKAWIKGERLSYVLNGILPDGIYRIKSNDGEYLQSNSDFNIQEIRKSGVTSKTYDKFVFYHLGENKYRIVNVYTGKPLRLVENKILTTDWTPDESSVFKIETVDESSEWELEPIGTFVENGKILKCKIIMSNGNDMNV